MGIVSVVMPAYNCERFIEEAAQSVLNQTFKELELIIIDDCSTDSTFQVAGKIAAADSRVRVFQMESNRGVARVRNFGIEKANGKYIALIDSDDVWLPNKLELQVTLMEEKNADVCYCSYDFIDEYGASIKKPFVVPEKTDFNKMLSVNVMGCSTVVIDSEVLKKHPFNPDYYHEDYVLWMEIFENSVKAVGAQPVLMHYRQISTSRSHNKANAAKQRWKVYREVLKLSVFKSTVSFVLYALKGVMKYYL